MAFLDQNQTQQQQGQQPTGSGPAPTGGSAPTVSGSGGSDVGGVSSAGVGAGGTGGWTNIQAYLNANQGNNGTAGTLQNQVGGAFGQEQQNLDKSSQQAKSAADQATANGLSQADLWNDVQGGTQAGWQAARNYLGSTYNPQNYSYGVGGQAQSYGQGLGSDQGFQGLMGNIYQKAAGQPLTTGQQALQSQLDTNNPNVASERQQLLSQYGKLQNNVADTNAGTNAYVQNAATNYNQGITDANTLLQGQAGYNPSVPSAGAGGTGYVGGNTGGGTTVDITPVQYSGGPGPQVNNTLKNTIQNFLNGGTGT